MIFDQNFIIAIKQKLLEIDEIAFLVRKYQNKSRAKRYIYVFCELLLEFLTPLILLFIFAHFIGKYW
jgi:hypothetical protein